MAARKGCWIALGIAGFVILAGGLGIGFIVYTVTRHLEIRPAAAAVAEEEFQRIRDRFTGQAPLVEVDRENPGNFRVRRGSERVSPGKITTLHVVAWDPREKKIAHVQLPVWLLRLKPRADRVQWNWGGRDLNLDDFQLTLEDLESHGPGLVLDFEDRRGVRVILWAD
jgi:hypothetical protein